MVNLSGGVKSDRSAAKVVLLARTQLTAKIRFLYWYTHMQAIENFAHIYDRKELHLSIL